MISTPQPEDPALAKLREEYLRQLVERYEARSKTFRTLLYGFVGFGSVFLLLVLMPFVGLHRQREAVNGQLDTVTRRAADLAVALDAYGKATAGFAALRSAIDGGADELRESLPTLAAPPVSQLPTGESNAAFAPNLQQSPVQQQAPIQPQRPPQQSPLFSACDPRGEPDARMNCRVAEQVRNQFADYAGLLETSVIGPIEKLPAGFTARPDPARLRRGLDSIQTAFEARLQATPRFWEQFGGKLDFFGQLKRDLDGYWTKYGFQEQKDALQAAQQSLDSATAALTARKISLESQEKGLVARLAQIESPLGKLPIGLVEGVQIFPLLMAIGFVWCCAVLIELVGMRRALKEGYRQRGPEQAALTDRHLSLVAPLWIARRDSPALDAGTRALLFTPIAIFGLSCALVMYYWLKWSDADGLSGQDRWLYGTLYLLAAIGLFLAAQRVLDLVRQVRTESGTGS